jgi:Domain of unknown function (DUF4129)
VGDVPRTENGRRRPAGLGAGPLLPFAVAGMAILAVIGAGAHGGLRLSDRGPLAGERGPILGFGVLLFLVDVVAIAAIHGILRRRRRPRRPPDDIHRFQEPIDPDVRWLRLVQTAAVALALLLPLLLLVVALRPLDPRRESTDSTVNLPALNTSEAVSRAALWTLVWLAVAVLVVWVLVLLRRMKPGIRRPLEAPTADEEYVDESADGDLEALESAARAGATALEASSDPRTAIIACYDAMEQALAEQGSPRNAWDTPTELLHRAAATGTVRSPAAARLTELFEEARFSGHALDQQDRRAAFIALGHIRAEISRLMPEARANSIAVPQQDGLHGSGDGATGAARD